MYNAVSVVVFHFVRSTWMPQQCWLALLLGSKLMPSSVFRYWCTRLVPTPKWFCTHLSGALTSSGEWLYTIGLWQLLTFLPSPHGLLPLLTGNWALWACNWVGAIIPWWVTSGG